MLLCQHENDDNQEIAGVWVRVPLRTRQAFETPKEIQRSEGDPATYLGATNKVFHKAIEFFPLEWNFQTTEDGGEVT